MFCGWGHRRACVCGICVTIHSKGGRFRTNRRPIINLSPKEKENEMPLDRPKPGELTSRNDPPFVDRNFARDYPTLNEMLTATQYGDNQPRTTSTLLIFVENGILRFCLNDRDNSRSAFFTAETFSDALAAIDAALLSNRVEWRMKNRTSTPF